MRRTGYAALAIAALATYLAAVLFLGDGLFGISLRRSQPVLLGAAVFVAAFAALAWLARRGRVSEQRLGGVTAGCFVVLASLLALDTAYSLYLNAITPPAVDEERTLWRDPNVWTREWMPRRFYPEDRGFVLHKPGSETSAESYGDLYYAGLEKLPTLARELLERRHISSRIDAFGFRDTGDLAATRIAALGDSYVFGVGVDQPDTWVEQLEKRLGEGVHNLGVSGSGPRAHFLLLQYLFERHPEAAAGIRHVLWMIFDGNDLEDPGTGALPAWVAPPSLSTRLMRGTLLEFLISLPDRVANQSVIGQLRSGRATGRHFGGGGAAPAAGANQDPYVVDGERIRVPLYRSERLGPRLFFAAYLPRVGRDAEYIANHPNRKGLEQTFADMAELSRAHGFDVTVLLAACSARQLGPYFENFPPVSDEPHFLNFVAGLAREHGFGVIDVYRALVPYAEAEGLFRRDDSHWNEQGNLRVAEIVARELAARPTGDGGGAPERK